MIIQKSTEFFRNLPPKICAKCRRPMQEQSESYMTVCDHCSTKAIK